MSMEYIIEHIIIAKKKKIYNIRLSLTCFIYRNKIILSIVVMVGMAFYLIIQKSRKFYNRL